MSDKDYHKEQVIQQRELVEASPHCPSQQEVNRQRFARRPLRSHPRSCHLSVPGCIPKPRIYRVFHFEVSSSPPIGSRIQISANSDIYMGKVDLGFSAAGRKSKSYVGQFF
jgi:hypothetical protein